MKGGLKYSYFINYSIELCIFFTVPFLLAYVITGSYHWDQYSKKMYLWIAGDVGGFSLIQ